MCTGNHTLPLLVTISLPSVHSWESQEGLDNHSLKGEVPTLPLPSQDGRGLQGPEGPESMGAGTMLIH